MPFTKTVTTTVTGNKSHFLLSSAKSLSFIFRDILCPCFYLLFSLFLCLQHCIVPCYCQLYHHDVLPHPHPHPHPIPVSPVHPPGFQNLWPEVRLPMGIVRGRTFRTNTGRDFYAFLGIPYATPPLGPLRFKVSVFLEFIHLTIIY